MTPDTKPIKEKPKFDDDLNLGFEIGDLNGEWEEEAKKAHHTKSKPVLVTRTQEKEKHHIKKSGKR